MSGKRNMDMPKSVTPTLDQCYFYHSLDLPSGTVSGDWDLRGLFRQYIGNVDLKGRTVLDIGTASGFLSFEAEKAGAKSVTSFDSDSAKNWQVAPDEKVDRDYFQKMRNGYVFAHHSFKSSAKCVLGNVYQVDTAVPKHDIVIVAQILVHLRDPLTALEAAARRAKEQIIIVEGMVDTEEPIAHYLGGRAQYAWWHLSRGIYRVWLGKLGFDITSHSFKMYHCNAIRSDVGLSTLVATRR